MPSTTYNIIIKTEERYRDASTNATVSIQLVGSQGDSTEWKVLDKFWRDDFEQGRIDEFTVECEDVGRPLLVRIKLEHFLSKDIWAGEWITVKYGEHKDEFPLYDWVSDHVEVARGQAILPQKVENRVLREYREKERRSNKQRFQWVEKAKPNENTWMLPRYPAATEFDGLPRLFRMEDVRENQVDELLDIIKINALIEKAKSWIFPINELEDYKRIFSHRKIPPELPPYVEERWQEDAEFGRQILNGANPTMIMRCTEIPKNCNISNEHVKNLLHREKTLEDEMADGRIYILDYSEITAGVERNTQYKTEAPMFCADSMALFYSPGNGKLLPIAIQLEPNREDSIFTPEDRKYDWLLAKMYFRCTDSNMHQWVSHFLRSHGVMEPVAFALFRCLSRTHPIFKLLRPHLQSVVAINQLARDKLIFKGSSANYSRSLNGADQARKGFEKFDFGVLNVPEYMKKRGVTDRDLLQNYHYRDDALLQWDIVKQYASGVVRHYYRSDEDVRNDFEIQDWISDIATEGLAWPDGNTRGCPTCFKTIEDLTLFVTEIIFASTVQHAANHYPQFDMYKFIPNAPGGMRLPIHKRGEGSLKRVLDTLPDITMATLLYGAAFALRQYSEFEVFFGDFPKRLFYEPEVLELQEQLRENLKKSGEKIRERNKSLEYPYSYLLPERMPASITS